MVNKLKVYKKLNKKTRFISNYNKFKGLIPKGLNF